MDARITESVACMVRVCSVHEKKSHIDDKECATHDVCNDDKGVRRLEPLLQRRQRFPSSGKQEAVLLHGGISDVNREGILILGVED